MKRFLLPNDGVCENGQIFWKKVEAKFSTVCSNSAILDVTNIEQIFV